MADNRTKKTITFSTIKIKTRIDNILADYALTTNNSSSFIVESLIQDTLLPKEPNARAYFEALYDGTCTLNQVINAVWARVSAEVEFNDFGAPYKSLAKYGYHDLLRIQADVSDYGHEADYYFNCMKLIKQILERENENLHRSDIAQTIDILNDNCRYINNPEFYFSRTDMMQYMYRMIIAYWDILHYDSYTYRMLACMARIQKWNTSPQKRVELIKIFDEIYAIETKKTN